MHQSMQQHPRGRLDRLVSEHAMLPTFSIPDPGSRMPTSTSSPRTPSEPSSLARKRRLGNDRLRLESRQLQQHQHQSSKAGSTTQVGSVLCTEISTCYRAFPPSSQDRRRSRCWSCCTRPCPTRSAATVLQIPRLCFGFASPFCPGKACRAVRKFAGRRAQGCLRRVTKPRTSLEDKAV